MNVRYITIEREYGSGGTKIARVLSEMTGIHCYGSEILEETAKKLGSSVEQIQEQEENMVSSFLYTVYLMGKAHGGDGNMLSSDGAVFVTEQEVIRQFATNGKGIFIGHCAGEALKDISGVARIFIRCSDTKGKNDRITQEYGIAPEKAEAVRKKYDHKRAHYYHCNTGKQWQDYNQYDVVLDSGTLGIDGCANVLKGLLED